MLYYLSPFSVVVACALDIGSTAGRRLAFGAYIGSLEDELSSVTLVVTAATATVAGAATAISAAGLGLGVAVRATIAVPTLEAAPAAEVET